MSPGQPPDGASRPVLGMLVSRREWLKYAMVAAAALATTAAIPRAHAKGGSDNGNGKGNGKAAEASAPASAPTLATFAATLSIHGVPGGPFPLRGWREEFPAPGSALELFAADSFPLKVSKDLDAASAALSALAHSGAVGKKARLTVYRSGLPWLRADFADVTIVATTLAVQASGVPEQTLTLAYQKAEWRDLAKGEGPESGKGAKSDHEAESDDEADDGPSLDNVA